MPGGQLVELGSPAHEHHLPPFPRVIPLARGRGAGQLVRQANFWSHSRRPDQPIGRFVVLLSDPPTRSRGLRTACSSGHAKARENRVETRDAAPGGAHQSCQVLAPRQMGCAARTAASTKALYDKPFLRLRERTSTRCSCTTRKGSTRKRDAQRLAAELSLEPTKSVDSSLEYPIQASLVARDVSNCPSCRSSRTAVADQGPASSDTRTPDSARPRSVKKTSH